VNYFEIKIILGVSFAVMLHVAVIVLTHF